MTKRLALTGMTLIGLTFALFGCDPKKDAPADNTTTPNTAPKPNTTAADPNAAVYAKFDTPKKATGPISIKVITNGSDPFWDTMGQGLNVGLKEADATGGWAPPDGTDNIAQKNLFEQTITANADGIAVSPIKADAFAAVIDNAIDKGIPVITFDSDAPTSKRLAYVGTNNFEAGRAAGLEAVKLFPTGGKLVAFVGNMSADNAKQRYEGFLDAVKGHNITMLQEPFEDDKDQTGRAHTNVATAITKYGDQINGFVGIYAYNGPAIVDEVTKAGKLGKVKIICFDGVIKTLDNLANNRIDVAVVQKPYEFGRVSAKLLALINRKGLTAALTELKPELEKEGMKVDVVKHIIDTGVTVVTPTNAPEFLKMLKEKGLKST